MEVEQPILSRPRDELPYRRMQQTLLARFGRLAMQASDVPTLLQQASELCAEGLEARFCKVLEYRAGTNVLLLQAGVGWAPHELGRATLTADFESPAGYAFHTGEAVLSNHLEAETRFRTPRLLRDHGIRRAVNVLIDRGGRTQEAFGILEVDSADPGQFDCADVDFLTGCAGILGVAVERVKTDQRLQEAMERQALLTREMSHRVKNSLSVVAGLLRVNANQLADPGSRSALIDAESCVLTIARVHDHLWRSGSSGEVELARFLTELCESLTDSTSGIRIGCVADPVVVNADNAIPVGLIVNELVTNAIKYAYEPGEPGAIEVVLVDRGQAGLCLSVTDFGKGLPVDFDINARRKSFGLRVIGNLVNQLNGVLAIEPIAKGTQFVLRFTPLA